MNDKKLLSMIQSRDDEACVLGCSILGRRGRIRVMRFFKKYGSPRTGSIPECLLERISRGHIDYSRLHCTALVFDDFHINCFYDVWLRTSAKEISLLFDTKVIDFR